jgi:hypothetical protein
MSVEPSGTRRPMGAEKTSDAYLVGVAPALWLSGVHAVAREAADWAKEQGDRGDRRVHVCAPCGVAVMVAWDWGAFRRGNDRLTAHQLCPHCAWTVAFDHGTVHAELAVLGPSPVELDAWRRLMPDPSLPVRVCQAILAERDAEKGYDKDSPRWAQLLGHVGAHRPMLLVGEDCSEGVCVHGGNEAACYAATNTIACPTCSVRAGQWAGEWEGQFEVNVPAPCSVLTAMAAEFSGAVA